MTLQPFFTSPKSCIWNFMWYYIFVEREIIPQTKTPYKEAHYEN